MDGALDDLLRHPALWRAADAVRVAAGAGPVSLPTGFAALDACLPGGGWPPGALVEVLYPESGVGELSLLLPALARLSCDGRWLAWIAPPYRLAVPGLEAAGVDPQRVLVVRCPQPAEALWAAEQALRSGACGAVLLWPRGGSGGGTRRAGAAGFRELRRLQLAAESGGSLGLVFRPARAAQAASPAAVRVLLTPEDRTLRVDVLKSRGGRRASVSVAPDAPRGGAGSRT